LKKPRITNNDGMKHAIITFLKKVTRVDCGSAAVSCPEEYWSRDPLSHPDIAKMSERERADLQWAPEKVVSE
jgi:hypothetical protein